jgi:hypothetical protein
MHVEVEAVTLLPLVSLFTIAILVRSVMLLHPKHPTAHVEYNELFRNY